MKAHFEEKHQNYGPVEWKQYTCKCALRYYRKDGSRDYEDVPLGHPPPAWYSSTISQADASVQEDNEDGETTVSETERAADDSNNIPHADRQQMRAVAGLPPQPLQMQQFQPPGVQATSSKRHISSKKSGHPMAYLLMTTIRPHNPIYSTAHPARICPDLNIPVNA